MPLKYAGKTPALVGALVGVAMVMAASSLALSQPDEAARQIAAGQAVFESRCAICHGRAGEGGFGGQLVGSTALRNYPTVAILLAYVQSGMPADAPGSLPQQDYFDVVAFLLNANNRNPDRVVLDADSIDRIPMQ
jgi:mono/diheme cytochrome c family protein